jgi:hypothetical protein
MFTSTVENISQRQRSSQIIAHRMAALHDETESLAKYLGRRKLELILPMMLQILKVVFIRGYWVTTAMVILICLDWAAVQCCQLWIWFSPDKQDLVWFSLHGQET